MEGSSKRNEITSASTGVCVCARARGAYVCVWCVGWDMREEEKGGPCASNCCPYHMDQFSSPPLNVNESAKYVSDYCHSRGS